MSLWNERVFIIAEAGVNHNGDVGLARQLIDAAAEAGADAVKFQTFRAAALVSREARMADYQKRNLGEETSQYEMLRRLELSDETQRELRAYAASRGILWFSTAFDPESLTFLISQELPVWKIPSGEITNYPYLRRIGALGRPVILSTGMSTLSDVEAALDVLQAAGTKREDICVLHCTTEYPAPWQDVNLRAMNTLGNAFGLACGYSDHTTGIEIPIAAVALGARVIEKHFTLDRTLPGPDHAASLEPAELGAMVTSIRHVELALGDGVKRLTPSERSNRLVARKQIVAARAIPAGHVLSEEDLAVRRPGEGISPMEWPRVVGRKAGRDYEAGDAIEW
ncbi:N-acetylneuraminate synthase [Pandoraea aquatica]|uniref:N-acetylneuraminate synthase n=1 Tax=Pandoraea aquatica TaxID=2508290 RepID=A0A5E4YMK7_9BURK|nr:N-acetylneuraminate synthase [Pandoraea aquatica]VVE49558.1 N-acetylneuraminate synthase [Pandoraea aquatica]